MAKDYTGNVATAKRLVEKFGRTMTFRKVKRTPDDSSKPWRGPGSTVRSAPEASVSGKVVAVSPDSARDLGFMVENTNLIPGVTQILIAAAGSFVGSNLEDFDEVVDTTAQKIVRVDVLKPGDVTLLYFIQAVGN